MHSSLFCAVVPTYYVLLQDPTDKTGAPLHAPLVSVLSPTDPHTTAHERCCKGLAAVDLHVTGGPVTSSQHILLIFDSTHTQVVEAGSRGQDSLPRDEVEAKQDHESGCPPPSTVSVWLPVTKAKEPKLTVPFTTRGDSRDD